MPEDFRVVGARCSNWGRWGEYDQRGTLNLITPESVRAAASELVRTGECFELGVPLGASGPQRGDYKRHNPVHLVSYLPGEFDLPHGIGFVDDYLFLPLQAATQWDALSHVCYGDAFYNGRPTSIVTSYSGARELSISAAHGVVGRGVLLDIAGLYGVDVLPATQVVTGKDLSAACDAQQVAMRPGDVLLVRTGWIRLLKEGQKHEFMDREPGLDLSAAEWCHWHDVAALACDNWGIEVVPSERAEDVMPLHCVCIRDMGMLLGEMFDLEDLAAACLADGSWDFFFSAPPLKVEGAVGSPLNPMVVR